MAKKNTQHEEQSVSAAALSSVPVETGNEPRINRANMGRKVIISDNYMSLYVNDIQLQTTPWDVRLVLGRILDISSGDAPSATVSQLAEVLISPQMAKKLTVLLIGQLRVYEEQMGPIPQPAD